MANVFIRAALEHAAKSNHHPSCNESPNRKAKHGGDGLSRCTCHVVKAHDALKYIPTNWNLPDQGNTSKNINYINDRHRDDMEQCVLNVSSWIRGAHSDKPEFVEGMLDFAFNIAKKYGVDFKVVLEKWMTERMPKGD